MRSHRFADIFPMMNEIDFSSLKKNIKEKGFDNDEPIIIFEDKILDGRNRYKAAKELKIEPKLKIYQGKDPLGFVIGKNLSRRHLTADQRAIIAQEVLPIFKEEAKKRQATSTGGNDPQLRQLIAQAEKGKATEHASKMFGVNKRYISEVKKLKKEGKEKEIQQIKTGEKKLVQVMREIKENKRESERKKDLEKVKNIKKPEDIFKEIKFTTIVIDPPWDWADEGDVNQLGRAKPDYSTMSFEELKKLPINNLTKDDAHIYLWITNRSLPKGFELLNEWGFRYITCLTWCKPSFGMGNYFRGSTEQILFGVKGSLPLKRKDIGTWFEAKRGNLGHSSKPEEFYKLVESASPGLYLDYFGREKREGWQVYGGSSDE